MVAIFSTAMQVCLNDGLHHFPLNMVRYFVAKLAEVLSNAVPMDYALETIENKDLKGERI